ncbi:uncharacterized protein si:ch211-248a14.8 isoform X2 [Cheilinus undulatus]|uniref:uncharacterized protein si:ch211-248a14.8 isoform X2 n=1 Tax=Cheilinus undulatus TaxID=241271 RepID=UPI001BD38CEC|nr:uncharacterized protein si:ch211-248a14.8 isoform X2 [Cheilinus undulatus]
MSFSSGRWSKGWCSSATKSLSSNHALKHLVPVFCLLVVIYGLADKLRNFVASIFFPQYHYPYAVAVCFAQVLVSIVFLNLLHLLNLVPLNHYSRSLGERVLVPSICSSIHAVLATWAKASSIYVSLFPVTLTLLPVVTVGFSFCLKLAPSPPLHFSLLSSLLCGTSFVITALQSVAGFAPLAYMYAPLALLLHSLSLTWLAKVSETERRLPTDSQASVFDIYYTQLVNQFWLLGLLWLIHPNSPWHVLSRSSWHSLLFHGYLLAILLLGMVLNFMVTVSAMCVSPLAAALLHSARQVVQPYMQLL